MDYWRGTDEQKLADRYNQLRSEGKAEDVACRDMADEHPVCDKHDMYQLLSELDAKGLIKYNP